MPASFDVRIPDREYWREMICCQHACPVGTDARGYVRAIAEGRLPTAPTGSRAGPIPLPPCAAGCAAPPARRPAAGERSTPRSRSGRSSASPAAEFGPESPRFSVADRPPDDRQDRGPRLRRPGGDGRPARARASAEPSSPPRRTGGDRRVGAGRAGGGPRPGPSGLPAHDLRVGARPRRHAPPRRPPLPPPAGSDPLRNRRHRVARRGNPLRGEDRPRRLVPGPV